MCVVSNIGDQWRDAFPERYPWYPPYTPLPGIPNPYAPPVIIIPGPTKEEFDALKKEVEALKELLKAAKKFDEETGQKNCEMDEKIDFIKKIAEFVGVDINEVFK
jgi:hypothetical protein